MKVNTRNLPVLYQVRILIIRALQKFPRTVQTTRGAVNFYAFDLFDSADAAGCFLRSPRAVRGRTSPGPRRIGRRPAGIIRHLRRVALRGTARAALQTAPALPLALVKLDDIISSEALGEFAIEILRIAGFARLEFQIVESSQLGAARR